MTGYHSVFTLAARSLVVHVLLVLAPNSRAESVTDAARSEVRCRPPLQRVVALAPNLATLVEDLGAAEGLAGVASREHWSSSRQVTSVGPYHDPDIEKILTLKPDLVLATVDGTPKRAFDRLRKSGVKIYASDSSTREGLLKTWSDLACLTGLKDEADRRRVIFEAALKRNRFSSTTPILLLISLSPPMAVNHGTWTASLVEATGLKILPLPSSKKYLDLDREWLRSQKPLTALLFQEHPGDKLSKDVLPPGSRTISMKNPAWIQPSLDVEAALAELKQL